MHKWITHYDYYHRLPFLNRACKQIWSLFKNPPRYVPFRIIKLLGKDWPPEGSTLSHSDPAGKSTWKNKQTKANREVRVQQQQTTGTGRLKMQWIWDTVKERLSRLMKGKITISFLKYAFSLYLFGLFCLFMPFWRADGMQVQPQEWFLFLLICFSFF